MLGVLRSCVFIKCNPLGFYSSVVHTPEQKNRSSPKSFDMQSEAICWILSNNYAIRHIVHLLDYFFYHIFPQLYSRRAPLNCSKVFSPSTSIEFLGVNLDSSKFQPSPQRENRQNNSGLHLPGGQSLLLQTRIAVYSWPLKCCHTYHITQGRPSSPTFSLSRPPSTHSMTGYP